MSYRFNTNRIRRNYSYTIQEICRLLSIHKNTVREWFRNGLAKTDTKRPCLIYGQDLKAFLDVRQKTRKKKCGPDQFYCFRCRLPRRSIGNLVDFKSRNEKTFNLIGICEVCETTLNKLQSVKKLPVVLQTFDLSKQQLEHISESLSPSLDCYLKKESQ